MLEILGWGILAGLATTLGALIVIAFGRPGDRTIGAFLGLAAGVMLAVVGFDLLPSAFFNGGWPDTLMGFGCGLMLIWCLDQVITLSNAPAAASRASLLKIGYLIAIGIAIHDLPEGIAIAVGYAATDKLGLAIALAIGLHNIPEGMAMAAPLWLGGLPGWRIIGVIFLVSLVTPAGTIIGLVLASFVPEFLALLLAMAAGTMSYLVKAELWPEARRRSRPLAMMGFLIGTLLIYSLTFFH